MKALLLEQMGEHQRQLGAWHHEAQGHGHLAKAPLARPSSPPPSEVVLQEYQLVVLAMQEPQYGSAGVRELMGRAPREGGVGPRIAGDVASTELRALSSVGQKSARSL